VVAVIDDGFDLYHPDLSGPEKIVAPKDFADNDAIPFPRKATDDYHGTPCAGVAIGEENGEGIVGIAPGCAFLPIRFDLAADDDLLWEIFDYAGSRAQVISCSWGPVPVYAPLSSLLSNQFSELAKKGGPDGKGCSIVFAAGNFNAPLKDLKNKHFEWFHPNHGVLTTRQAILNGNAAHPDVIAVSASTSQNRKSAYSNWGKEIAVCAPSDNWHPIDQQAFVPGRGIWTTDNESFGTGFTSNRRYTDRFGGTSSATPLVAGIIALMRSVNAELSHRQIQQILKESTDKIEDHEADIVLQHQKGTYNAKGHSEWFGYGKINAAKAVALAQSQAKKETEVPVSPTPQSAQAIYIIAALVNPRGAERGAESVSLFNISDRAIDLDNWILDSAKRSKELIRQQIIAPGAHLLIPLSSLRLSNSGGRIRLLNPTGQVMHEVTYTRTQAKREGWQIKF
ncbi:MAG: S8 family serine peptidase, partial [Bacteroidota bacterium]